MNSTIRRLLEHVALLIPGIIGGLVILVSTKTYGLGLSPDSSRYISSAQNIFSGFISYDDTPMVHFPPLYSVTIAVIHYFLPTNIFTSTRIINIILFGYIIYLTGVLLLMYSKSTLFAILGSVSTLVSIPLTGVAVWAWSETLFIALLVTYLLLFEYHRSRLDLFSTILLSISVALLALTRYIGIIFWLIGILNINSVVTNRRQKIFQSTIFTLISMTPITLWILRNYLVSGTLFGARVPSESSLLHNITLTIETITSWYVPSQVSSLIFIPLLGTFIITYFSVFRKQISKETMLTIRILIIMIIVYVSFLVLSSSTISFDPIGDRLLAPVYVPLSILLLYIISKTYETMKNKLRFLTLIFLVIAFLVWSLYPYSKVSASLNGVAVRGIGYSSPHWRNNSIVQYLQQNKTEFSDCSIHSNGADAIYSLTMLPAKRDTLRPQNIDYITFTNSNACLVWFNSINRPYLLTFEQIESIFVLEEVFSTEEGAIYTIKSRKS